MSILSIASHSRQHPTPHLRHGIHPHTHEPDSYFPHINNTQSPTATSCFWPLPPQNRPETRQLTHSLKFSSFRRKVNRWFGNDYFSCYLNLSPTDPKLHQIWCLQATVISYKKRLLFVEKKIWIYLYCVTMNEWMNAIYNNWFPFFRVLWAQVTLQNYSECYHHIHTRIHEKLSSPVKNNFNVAYWCTTSIYI